MLSAVSDARLAVMRPAMQRSTGDPGYTFAASVGDALLYQFKEYARIALVRMGHWHSAKLSDMPITLQITLPPHVSVQDNADVVPDASYEKVLQGLQVRRGWSQPGTTTAALCLPFAAALRKSSPKTPPNNHAGGRSPSRRCRA